MDIAVLVVDDEALIRAGFRVLVDSAPGMHVVGEAADGAEAVRAARVLRPDVVLLDLRMPVMNGVAAAREITQAGPVAPRVLVVTTIDRDEHVFDALRAGASGFLLKDTPPERLIEAIRLTAAGEALLSPTVTRQLITEFVTSTPVTPSDPLVLTALTDRERQVLVEVAAGRSNSEIAARLRITRATAKTHVSNLLAKLNARDRIQLVILAYESGLVAPTSRRDA